MSSRFERSVPVLLAVLAAVATLSGCPGAPRPLPGAPVDAGEDLPRTIEPEAFDASSVPEEARQDALLSVRILIEELNGIIRRKDYDAWLSRLSEEYVEHFSRPPVLEELSKAKTLQRQGITLTTLLDYFLYVVYPSRQFDRVDDIEFVAADRVKAITVTPKGERLVLYELAKYGDTWKISIGRQP
ncbi:MAG: hypothetical protein JXA15_07020 [Spirochaetales bacterium]|nr:hypothetical protein [Spirochaetales bacterium]